jgi:hypothetical protein
MYNGNFASLVSLVIPPLAFDLTEFFNEGHCNSNDKMRETLQKLKY